MRKILVANDDGITSEGIVRLAELAKKFGPEGSYAFVNGILAEFAD